MARDAKPESETEVPVEAAPTTAAAAAPAVEENRTDERYRMVTRPGTSEQVKRKDYILELWTGAVTSNNPEGKRWTRGDIAKHLSEITGKKVPYQIVFAATKKIAGGPPKEAPVATPPAETPAA